MNHAKKKESSKNTNQIILNEDEANVCFDDGESTIDYVLVYVKNLSICTEFDAYALKVRESFVKVLTNDYKIQVQEVLFAI